MLARSGRRQFLGSAAMASVVPQLKALQRVLGVQSSPDFVASVAKYGATGDGQTDDTAAFRAAIAAVPMGGGTLVVPPGVFRINAVEGVTLRSGLIVRLAPGAILEAMPTSMGSYAILRGVNVAEVQIHGGELRGDREQHTGTAGEWGMGIDLRGCTDVLLQSVTVRACWGDGIYVGHTTAPNVVGGECRHVVMRGCDVIGNRRQGVSLVGCVGATIEECTITDTQGTNPQSGIDLEPNGVKVVSDVSIAGCQIARNAGWGVQTWGKGVTGTVLIGNTITDNRRGGIYFATGRDQGGLLYNRVTGNRGPSMQVGDSTAIPRSDGNLL